MPVENHESYERYFSKIVGRSEKLLMSPEDISDAFADKRILIIGAGGTIGSSIVDRLNHAGLNHLYITDRDESALHAVILKNSNKNPHLNSHSHVADIRDLNSLKEVFECVKPEIVFHAAALKHLPVLEKAPREGFLTNIIGTLHVAQLCLEFGTLQLVNISTDKAAHPTSILGKTKKLAEILVEELAEKSSLIQCSVRFGNVFASRGSVIETFSHQIINSQVVTITHPEVSRFFMSRNEAAELVLIAASLKESGTFIQDMGSQVPILEIVNRMASDLRINPQIRFIGLSQGEKLQEELFDGPAVRTKFSSILQSKHELRRGLLNDLKIEIPENNNEAKEMIEALTNRYIL